MAQAEDRRRISFRLGGLQVGAAVVFVVLAFSFWYLQVLEGDKYRELAENNHQRTLALRAPRGVLYDRNLKPLVESRPSSVVSLDRQRTTDLNATIDVLARIAGLDPAQVRETVERHKSEPRYRPIPVIEDATAKQVARIKARRMELPGVIIEDVPARKYPVDGLAAHLFGYVGQVSEQQVTPEIPQGSIVGKSGVELVYNKLLMGEDGIRRVRVNSVGREIPGFEEKIFPVEGRRVQLTIDYDLPK